MKNAILATSLILSFAGMTIQSAHAENNGKFSLETGMDYSTGKYGGTQSTDILYVPFTGKYQGSEWTLKLTVPYLRITGPSNVLHGIGATGATTSTTTTTRSGMGDVIMSASHSVYRNLSAGFMANLTGKVKLGTASSDQGLGTGKTDYSLQADLYQVTGKLTTFGTLGYRVYGKPSGYTLNNVFYGDLGSSYKFNQETNGGAMMILSQKVSSTGSPHAEALLFLGHKIQKNWNAQGYVLKGFTNSVPDWGAGVSLAYLL